jgi:polyribonucleotide nucleotidyltransferase
MIDSGKVGKIVGAKGAIIQELQSNFEVKINISKEDDEVSLKLKLHGFKIKLTL